MTPTKKAPFSNDTVERRFFRSIQLVFQIEICSWSEAEGFRSPFPLVLRDFSTLLHIPFHFFYTIKHKYDRSKWRIRPEAHAKNLIPSYQSLIPFKLSALYNFYAPPPPFLIPNFSFLIPHCLRFPKIKKQESHDFSHGFPAFRCYPYSSTMTSISPSAKALG